MVIAIYKLDVRICLFYVKVSENTTSFVTFLLHDLWYDIHSYTCLGTFKLS